VISVMLTTRRVPSLSRAACTIRWMAAAICCRIESMGMLAAAKVTITSSREMASRGVLACTVVSDPSWPVFMACSMSSASSPRTSPQMMRSGRIRRLLINSSRCFTAPVPSRLGGRVSSRTTCGCFNCNSAASSMVTIRSRGEMKADRALSRVVLPAPVPPEMMMFSRAFTAASSSSIMAGVVAFFSTRSGGISLSVEKRRMDRMGPSTASGGMMAFTREPSISRASTMGDDSSIRRPTCETILSMMRSRCASSRKVTLVSSSTPLRSM
jgi:hypothetical protein